MIIFFLLYQILQILVLPFFITYIIVRKFKGKPVFGNLKERIGLIPIIQHISKSKTPVIWIHAVSVGEILSTEELINKIKQTIPNAICYLTTGTLAGKNIAQQKINCDYISFLPYDFLLPMLLAFKRIKPSTIIIIEAELWPNLLMLAKLKNIPAYLLNARINKKNQNRYLIFKPLLTTIFNMFKTIFTQSKYDKEQLQLIGTLKEKIKILGNLKAFNVLYKQKRNLTNPTILNTNNPTLLVGSLHPGELNIYLNLFTKLKSKYCNLKLIFAPRHFHWQKELINKVKATKYNYEIWTEKTNPKFNLENNSWDILLVCKLGELFNLYQHATIFFLGGTFVPIGGHNLLEPAVWSKVSIIGPQHHNCHVIAQQLNQHNALIIASDKDGLFNQTKYLLDNPNQTIQMGENAKKWLLQEADQVEQNINLLLKQIQNKK